VQGTLYNLTKGGIYAGKKPGSAEPGGRNYSQAELATFGKNQKNLGKKVRGTKNRWCKRETTARKREIYERKNRGRNYRVAYAKKKGQ